MDAYDPGNPPLNLDFKRRNRCFGRRNRKGIKGPRNPMVVGLAMALGLLLRGPERVGKGYLLGLEREGRKQSFILRN
eukprot:1333257-Amorphochlora_amoeboformis.AAC.1